MGVTQVTQAGNLVQELGAERDRHLAWSLGFISQLLCHLSFIECWANLLTTFLSLFLFFFLRDRVLLYSVTQAGMQ